MKKPLYKLFCGGILAFLSTATFLAAEPIKLLSWNIEWFPGGRPNPDKSEAATQTKLVIEKLTEINPQILLVQEITDPNALKRMVEKLPGNLTVLVCSQFIDSETKDLAPQQVAIVSSLRADRAFFQDFKPNEAFPSLRRGFAFAALEHPKGGLIMAYSVHLKSNRGSETPEGEQDVANTRKESVRQILAHKAEMETRYAGQKIIGWVVGGDYNTNHDGQFPKCTAIADMEKGGFFNTWQKTPKDQRFTWHTNPFAPQFLPTTFDYVMTAGFKESLAKAIPVPREASDHDAVLLMLEKK